MNQSALSLPTAQYQTNAEYNLPRGLLLHVGCGPMTPDGWVNMDASWNLVAARVPGLRHVLRASGLISDGAAKQAWSGKIRYSDLRKPLPFRDGEVAVVYASHVLEHLAQRYAITFVREAHRVLAPNGVIRLVVPDLERLTRAYLASKENGASRDH